LDRRSPPPFTIPGRTFPAFQNSNLEKFLLTNDQKRTFKKSTLVLAPVALNYLSKA
jgi:hypothetical protein